MKKIIALSLIAAALLGLSSCKLIRKATEQVPEEKTETSETPGDETYSTDFADTEAAEDDTPADLRCTPDDAYKLLYQSFPDVDPSLVKAWYTESVIATDDGTEYYIFEVTLPEKPETDDTDDEDDGDTETETEIVYGETELYYVSVNGVVHKEIDTTNMDSKHAAYTYLESHGTKDSKTGYEYKLEYEGLVSGTDTYCYNFAVYLKNTSTGSNDYVVNYLVTIDGKLSAESTKN